MVDDLRPNISARQDEGTVAVGAATHTKKGQVPKTKFPVF